MMRQIILILCCIAGLSACVAHDDRPALPHQILPPTDIGQSLPGSH